MTETLSSKEFVQKLTSLNYGQHLLFSYLCISISGRKNTRLSLEETCEVMNQVIELTHPELYDYKLDECPDVKIMVKPEDSYKIFCEFYDENENYFVDSF